MSYYKTPMPARQLAIFLVFSGLAFGAQYLQAASLEQPPTVTPEIKEQERSKYLFQGDKRDPLSFNYAKNAVSSWPKWDRRDDPEDNVYEETVKSMRK